MKIVFLDLKWSYGIEVLTQQLARHLGANAEVTVISAEKPQLGEGPRIARRDGYLDSALALVNPRAYSHLLKRVRAADPDIIYLISPHVLNVPLVLLCRLFTNAIVISHIHDPEYAGRPMVAAAANLVARLQSRWSHRVYCWGRAIKETIGRNFRVPSDRIAVFPHGPGHSTPADEPGAISTQTPRHFSMIGTIIPRKGVEYFLEAARLFNERHGTAAAQFLLAGSGDLQPYRAALERLPNVVVMNRFLEDPEVNEILARSYASVLPYTAGVMQSSFVAIAYGNGCPVIVSNIGSLPEGVEEGRTGYVVEKANAAQIAEAMTRIYEAPDRTVLSENCLALYRKKFTWNAICAQMFADIVAATGELRKSAPLGQQVPSDQA